MVFETAISGLAGLYGQLAIGLIIVLIDSEDQSCILAN
jgi:hypothetical protein